MDDAAPFFPVRADAVGVFRNFQTVADGESRAGALDHFFGFVDGVNRERDDVDVFLFEFFEMGLVVGNLPNAVGSPDATIVNDNGVFGFEVAGDV